jgi:hypothetical protein
MLMPAAVLVVIVLGAIAVDLSIVHLGEREVSSAASAAVNDAVTHGLDEQALYADGHYSLDPAEVRQVITTSLAAQEQSGRGLRLRGEPVLTDRDADGLADTVEITVFTDVEYLFAPALPGAPREARVEATASASALRP